MRKLAVGFWVVGWAFSALAVDLPTMGWSSWNTYRVNISEELIKRQADALVDGGFAAVGYTYVNIDDGWFGGRDRNGRHTTNPKRFPNGLKPVVDYIHAKGLKAGAYSDAGENTCGSIWDNDVLGIGVGFYGHDEEDARWFFDEMDFDFIKIDFGGGTPQGNKAHVVMNEKERYTAIAKAIAKTKKGAAGKVRMNVCCWRYPGSWVSELAGSWRISGDVAATWESVKGIIDKNSYFARFQKPGHYNDMDMLEVGRGLTEEEDKTHFGMWCMMASPLLIGCDLTTIKPETAKLLKNTDLIAINQDPLGIQAEVAWRDWKHDIRVYAKPLAPAGSMNKAIALYNGTDDERTITAELDALGYDWNQVSVWDCYENRAVTNAVRTFAVKVPAHGTRIYRLSAEITVDSNMPAGNVIVDGIDGDVVNVRKDLRDTAGDWIYWAFRVKGATGRTLTFKFPNVAVGSRGAAVSLDRGGTWIWSDDVICTTLETNTLDHASWEEFSWRFSEDADEVWFSQTIPYTQRDWEAFIARHGKDYGDLFVTNTLCLSRKGRAVECGRFGRIDGKARHKMLLTSRHHCAETTATFVLEGILETVFADDDLGKWFRENMEIRVVPFADKDGVVDGDQGKNRKPHDHARDYNETSIYPEVRAIREMMEKWNVDGGPSVVMDVHCPWLRGSWFVKDCANEYIYTVGIEEVEAVQKRFCEVLERVQCGGLGFLASDHYSFGRGWNAAKNYTQGLTLTQWALKTWPDTPLVIAFEIPFANARYLTLYPPKFRAFGRDIAAAIKEFLGGNEVVK